LFPSSMVAEVMVGRGDGVDRIRVGSDRPTRGV